MSNGTEKLDPTQLSDHELCMYANSSGFREDDEWFREVARRLEKYLGFYDDVQETWEE